MLQVENFLTIQEEQEIISAIQIAEKNTSGEIRVHIEASTNIVASQRALEVFHLLKMDATKLQNSVLIYVAVHDKKFVIYGDKGIDKVVPENFWNTTKNTMQAHFITGEFKEAIVAGVLKTGQELKAHFPWQTDDQDELSNKISKG
ncbi:TPM domain-containing protein [Tenacibaculum finnmarkense]|uniref:TPM domain-containing protein n=1 Tax=Tenacibaculum finnmarkense TaxID=2781243 RepID=UPI001E3A103A|nr:TPM domain-containing protein [Tenacibaculum finnmarkense]MCD8410288.1 TPM domain-containing protein [Tenacibaculum finnmarkense genomovar ulcerans]MCG8795625.1 TPM domain-containing protein [Tenacibaculum finnmarkense]MCG8798013.1 TPM domain-containing protein [Tenacibaculum finnmarkense]